MMLFTATIGVEANPGTRIRDIVGPKVQLETLSIVEKATTMVTAQHSVKNALKCSKKNHFKSVCKAGGSNNDKHNHSRTRSKKSNKGKKFHEVNETENTDMDDLQEQVQSLFYHDVHFNNGEHKNAH